MGFGESFCKVRWSVLVGVITGIFFCVIMFYSSFVVLFTRKNIDPSDSSFKAVDHQYSIVNHNESSYGVIRISNEDDTFRVEDYHFSKDNEGNYLLISKFGSNEYICRGYCSCENERRLLSSTSSLSRGLIFLVSSLTVFIANQKAKEYFDSECSEKLLSECPSHSISSSVISCEGVDSSSSVESSAKSMYIDYPDIRRFFCKGHCLPKQLNRKQSREIANNFGCENLMREGEVEFDVCMMYSYYRQSLFNVNAISKFTKQYLTNYCRENSVVSYDYFWKGSKYPQKRKFEACVGRWSRKINPSVHCRQVHPKPKREISKQIAKHWD